MAVTITTEITKDNINKEKINLDKENWVNNTQIATQGNVVETIASYNQQIDNHYYDKEQIVNDENLLKQSLDYLATQLQANYVAGRFRQNADTEQHNAATGAVITTINKDTNDWATAGILQKINIISQLISGKTGAEWNADALGNVVGKNSNKIGSIDTPIIGLLKPTDKESTDYGYEIDNENVKGLTSILGGASGTIDKSKDVVLSEAQVAAMVRVAIKDVHKSYNEKLASITSYLLYTTKGLSDSFRWVLINGTKTDITKAPLYVKGWDKGKKGYILVKAGIDIEYNGTIKNEGYYIFKNNELYESDGSTLSTRYVATLSTDGKTITVDYLEKSGYRSSEGGYNYTINVPTYTVEFDVGVPADKLVLKSLVLPFDSPTSIKAPKFNSSGNGIAKVELPLGSQFTIPVRDTIECFHILNTDLGATTGLEASYVYVKNSDGIRNFSLKEYGITNADEGDKDAVLENNLLITCRQIQVNLYVDDSLESTIKAGCKLVDEFSLYKVELTDAPSKAGFTINGASYKADNSSSSDITISNGNKTIKVNSINAVKSFDIYYTWTVNKGIVCLKYNYEDCPEDIVIEAKGNGTVNLPNVTRDGYVFEGWYDSPSGSTNDKITSFDETNNGLTLYAYWSNNKYSIKYITNGGSVVDDEVSAEFNKETTLATPTRLGYTFLGWNTSPNFTGTRISGNINVSGNMTLYAEWSLKDYTISYDLNDSTQNSATGEVTTWHFANFQKFNVSQLPLSLGIPENTGYNFKDWLLGKQTINVIDLNTIKDLENDTISLTAKWEPKEVEYTIELYCQQGTVTGKANYDLYSTYQHITTKEVTTKTGSTESTRVKAKVNDVIDIKVIETLEKNKVISVPSGFNIKTADSITLSGNKENVIKVFNDTIKFKVKYHNVCFFDSNMSKELTDDNSNIVDTTSAVVKEVSYSMYATPLPTVNAENVRKGFVFKGWINSLGKEVTEIPPFTDGEVDYYAKWEQESPVFDNIKYNAKDANTSNILEIDISENYKNSNLQKLSFKVVDYSNIKNIICSKKLYDDKGVEKTETINSETIYGVSATTYADIDDFAHRLYVVYDEITMDNPTGYTVCNISAAESATGAYVTFKSKPIYLYDIAKNTYKCSNTNINVTELNNNTSEMCLATIYPYDIKNDSNDSSDIDEFEIKVNRNLYKKSSLMIHCKTDAALTDNIQISSKSDAINIYWKDTERYAGGNGIDFYINNKDIFASPSSKNPHIPLKTKTIDSVGTDIQNIFDNTDPCRYYMDGNNIKPISTALTASGILQCRIKTDENTNVWVDFSNSAIKSTNQTQTVEFKYKGTDQFNESVVSSYTLVVKTNKLTLNPNNGYFIENKNLIKCTNVNAGSANTLAVQTSSTAAYTINLIGNQNIDFLGSAVTRAGYNYRGYATTSGATEGSYEAEIKSDTTYYTVWTPKELSINSSQALRLVLDDDPYESNGITYRFVDDKVVYGKDATVTITGGNNLSWDSFTTTPNDAEVKKLSSNDEGVYLIKSSLIYYNENDKYTKGEVESKSSITFNKDSTPNTITLYPTASTNAGELTFPSLAYGIDVTASQTPAIINNTNVSLSWTGDGVADAYLSITVKDSDFTSLYKYVYFNGTNIYVLPFSVPNEYEAEEDGSSVTIPENNKATISPDTITSGQSIIELTGFTYTSEKINIYFLPTFNENYPLVKLTGQSVSNATPTDTSAYTTNDTDETVTINKGWTATPSSV